LPSELRQGKKLRETTARKEQGIWKVPVGVGIRSKFSRSQTKDRIPDLVPLRIGRMFEIAVYVF